MGDSFLEPDVPLGYDLAVLQFTMSVWRSRNFPDTKTAMHQTLGVAEECGELCHSVLKAEQGIRGDEQQHQNDAADAVGDIIIYLTGVCDALNIDMAQAVHDAAYMVLQRDWVKYPGNGMTE